MSPFLIPLIEDALILTCAAFAYREGQRPERLGALWLGANTIAGVLLLGGDSPTVHLVLDGVYAVGLLPLAIIYVSYWVGLLTLIAAALFGLEAVYLVNDWPIDRAYADINNALGLAGPLVMLICGLANGWRRRRRSMVEERAFPQPV